MLLVITIQQDVADNGRVTHHVDPHIADVLGMVGIGCHDELQVACRGGHIGVDDDGTVDKQTFRVADHADHIGQILYRFGQVEEQLFGVGVDIDQLGIDFHFTDVGVAVHVDADTCIYEGELDVTVVDQQFVGLIHFAEG